MAKKEGNDLNIIEINLIGYVLRNLKLNKLLKAIGLRQLDAKTLLLFRIVGEKGERRVVGITIITKLVKPSSNFD